MLPNVLTEDETLDLALGGRSLARYGDGELRICRGGASVSQKADPRLRAEMCTILSQQTQSLACIPHVNYGPKKQNWRKYTASSYLNLMCPKQFGSAFITRPDSAPDIDRPDYWEKVRGLWRDRDVTLVVGDQRSLRAAEIEPECRSLRVIMSTTHHAYDQIDKIEEQVGRPSGIVLMCLGACATALAERLARKGVHAVDIGHIGMFMRRRRMFGHGLYSPEYQKQLRECHEYAGWRSGHSHRDNVVQFAKELGATSILDYGAGKATLGPALEGTGLDYRAYDPGIKGIDYLPAPADLVVCTDVLEHIETGSIHNVLDHIWGMSNRGAFLTISCSPSKVLLPDGQNSHLTIRPPETWLKWLDKYNWVVVRKQPRKGIWIWLRKMDKTERAAKLEMMAQ